MIFTSRVASVMVRASILIDLVFSKTLIRKARLTLGFFLRPSSHVPGRKLRTRSQMPGASGSRGRGLGPVLKPGKDNDCNVCIFCYTVFSKWKTATNPEMPGQSGSVMVDLNKNEAGDRYLLEFAYRSGKRLNDTSFARLYSHGEDLNRRQNKQSSERTRFTPGFFCPDPGPGSDSVRKSSQKNGPGRTSTQDPGMSINPGVIYA